MTDPTPQPTTQPLWSDAEIAAFGANAASLRDARAMYASLQSRRDKYEQERRQLHARIAELEQRSQWQPLPDGTHHTDSDILLRVDGGRLIVYSGGIDKIVVDLPRGISLCGRAEKGATP